MSVKTVGAVLLAGMLILVVAFLFMSAAFQKEVKFVEAVSYTRLETDVLWDGSARCRYVVWQPPSYISSFNKLMVQRIGEDIIASSYEESIRKYYAMMGFEIENFSCDISGMGENDNFTLTFTWTVPFFARWNGESWEIELDWVNRELGAEDAISEGDSEWIFIRSLARGSGCDFGVHVSYSTDFTFLPEGAENVRLSSDYHSYADYGGGSYSESFVWLQEVDGRSVFVDNMISFTATENEMTITVDQMLAEFAPSSVSYSGQAPAGWSFMYSLEWPRLDLKYGRPLMENYPVRLNGTWYSMTPAQILRCSAKFLLDIYSGDEFSAPQPPAAAEWPGQEEGDWETFWSELSREEYISLAAQASTCEVIPEWFDAPVGRMRPSDLLYTFLRVISEYRKSGSLPDMINIAPVPSGEVRWGSNRIGADNAYYLLSDPYVVVDGRRALEVLDNLIDNLDNRKLVEEICNWTGSNISYGLYFRPPTSEEMLGTRRGQCRDFTNVYLALSRSAGIPARRISGWITSSWQPPAGWEFVVTTTPDGRTVSSHAWVEAFVPGEGWIPLEPQSNRPALFVGELPYDIYRSTEQTWIGALAGYETAEGLL